MRNKALMALALVDNSKSFTSRFEQVMEMNHSPIIHIKEILNTKYGNKKRDWSLINQESSIWYIQSWRLYTVGCKNSISSPL